MKKSLHILSCALAAILLLFPAACASKYEAEKCASPLTYASDEEKYFYLPQDRPFDFDRKIEEEGLTVYYESGMDGRKIDRAIDGLKRIAALGCVPITAPVYLTGDTVTHVNRDGLWLSPEDPAELVCAALLYAAADTALPAVPFGIFAGIAAALMEDGLSFPIYDEEKLEARLGQYPYAKELQYPLYTDTIATKAERETAWNYAYRLGKQWLQTHDGDEAVSLDGEVLIAAFTQFGATMSETYCFVLGDGYYPIQILTPNLYYCFAHNFEDLYFTEKYYGGSYKELTTFVKENETFIENTTKIFGYEGFPERISCFFGNEELNIPSIGEVDLREHRIACNAMGAFCYLLMCWVHEFSPYRGYPLQWAANSLFAYDLFPTTYSTLFGYCADYLGVKARRGGTSEEHNETVIEAAVARYRKKYGKPTRETFSYRDFLHCIALCADELYDGKIAVSGQMISLAEYIYSAYGFETLMMFCLDGTDTVIGEKTFEDLLGEHRAWLSAMLS